MAGANTVALEQAAPPSSVAGFAFILGDWFLASAAGFDGQTLGDG